jgi:hypothetical protein
MAIFFRAKLLLSRIFRGILRSPLLDSTLLNHWSLFGKTGEKMKICLENSDSTQFELLQSANPSNRAEDLSNKPLGSFLTLFSYY